VSRTERPRKITESQNKIILELIEQNRETVIKDIYSKAKKRKIDVSLSTIRRKIVEAGLEFGLSLVKFLLTDKHIQNQVA
jgi:transposase